MNLYPFVSIIMPIRNEAAFIKRSLSAVLRQDYPPDRIEVIVVDGMSDDGTRKIVQQTTYNTQETIHNRPQPDENNLSPIVHQSSIVLLDNPSRIVSTGLNAAIRKAKGEIIIRVDGHCEIASDYVSRCVKHLLKGQVDGVGGPIETIGITPLSQAIAIAMSSPFGVGGSAFRTVKDKEMLVDTVAFPAYTRRAIQMAGSFDEELVRNQDDEYNYRLRELGCTILLSPDVRSRYYSRSSFYSLWRQYFQYGYWKVRVMQKHLRQMRLRQFVPPVFVATLLVGALLAPFSTTIRHLWFGFFALYALTNLTASLWTARTRGWRYLPLIPIAFITLHLSYGLGFLLGLVKFRNRWRDNRTDVPALQSTRVQVDADPAQRS